MAIDNDKLMDFLHRFVGDLGATHRPPATSSSATGSASTRRWPTGPATPGELAERTGTAPAVRHRVAARSGGRRLRRRTSPAARRPTRSPRSRPLPDRPGQRRLRSGRVPARARRAAGRAADHRGLPHRRRHRLARARRRRARRLRAVLPPRLPRQPRRPAGSPRSTAWRPSSGRRPRRRHRLRARRLERAHGAGLPGVHDHRLGLPRRRRSSWPASAAGRGRRLRPGRVRGGRAPRRSAAPATTW